jgi:hypothetical protein
LKGNTVKTFGTFQSKDQVVLEHQTGSTAHLATGCEVELFANDDTAPRPEFAELRWADDAEHFGLEWDGNTLTGFDGGFYLPNAVADALLALGLIVDKAEFCS